MKRVGDLMGHYDLSSMKQNSILSLSKYKEIKNFFSKNHLDLSLMEEYWVELLDYKDDHEACLHCTSLDTCPKDNKGIKKKLVYRDQEIYLDIESCQYASEWENKRNILNNYVISNVNDKLLLTNLSELDILKKPKLTQNEQVALAYVYKYIKEPTKQGLFLHGESGCGKTTLLAALMNALAKDGKEVGFIHFPTYLIDLKASFSSGSSDYAMEKLMKVDYLLLDGIGEENVTTFSRDEILLSILSYRLLNQLPTFFTSMYGYKDLAKVYTIKKGDEIRVHTLISKIQSLSREIMLDGGKIG